MGNLLTGIYTPVGAWFLYHLGVWGKALGGFCGGDRDGGLHELCNRRLPGLSFVTRTCLNVSRSLITELREGTYESLMIATVPAGGIFWEICWCRRLPHLFGGTRFRCCGVTVRAEIYRYECSGFSGEHAVVVVRLLRYPWCHCIMLYTRDTYISRIRCSFSLSCVRDYLSGGVPSGMAAAYHGLDSGERRGFPDTGSTLLGKDLMDMAGTAAWYLGSVRLPFAAGFLMMRKTENMHWKKWRANSDTGRKLIENFGG